MNINLSSIQPPIIPPPSRSTSLTQEQQACVDWIINSSGNLIIEAVAGSGKTFTIIEMLVEVVLQKLATGCQPYKVAALMAFNSKVAKELQDRINKRGLALWVTVGTVHKFGFDAFKAAHGSRKPNGYKLQDIIEPMLKAQSLSWKLSKPLQTLVGMAKDTGVGVLVPNTPTAFEDIIYRQDITWDEDTCSLERFISIAREVLSTSVLDLRKIDFSDMIYFPLLQDLPFPQYEYVFIDEAQDTNATRREVARRMLKWPQAPTVNAALRSTQYSQPTGHLICVGDRHQAIYGFTGADNDALDILKREFSCQELPLSVCFRCAKSIITHARKLVNHIHPRVDALDGAVVKVFEHEFERSIFNNVPIDLPASAILCRKNAPLVSLAFRLIKAQIPCRIEGKDIGQDMIRLCKKVLKDKDNTCPQLILSLKQHLSTQSNKLSDIKLDQLADKIYSITALAQGFKSTTDLYNLIETLFSDYDPSLPKKLTLSSVHKSKGLEWPTVYLLGRNSWMPSKFATQPWMLEQENNLIYVAITRAQEVLVEVTVTE